MTLNPRSGIASMIVFSASFFALSSCQQEFAFQPHQAIAQTETIQFTTADLPPLNSDICQTNPEADACNRDPEVTTPGVVTVLFTMSQIPQGAASLIIGNAIKYASPVKNPRVLFLKDSATHGEDEGDADYIKNVLLAGYNVEYREIPAGGLPLDYTFSKDLVIVSNPGHPLSDPQTLTTLEAFKGGVILLGDDLAQGASFSVEDFTGITFRDNGAAISCGGNTFAYDNLLGYSYQIEMNTEFLPGLSDQYKNYTYGNDIDIGEARSGTQVLAWAKADASTCDIGSIPSIVRREK